ncbi:hypothetical protein ANN_01427, partial [Periplaneta americana]
NTKKCDYLLLCFSIWTSTTYQTQTSPVRERLLEDTMQTWRRVARCFMSVQSGRKNCTDEEGRLDMYLFVAYGNVNVIGEITDIKFLCLNGTVFDQETRVCERVDEVDCSKTEGFYDLNLELYGNNAALSELGILTFFFYLRFSFPEEEDEEANESQDNTESSDTSSNAPGSKRKTSTSKPSTTRPPSSTPVILHPASTTTPKIPVHPFVPTTTVPTYKPQHITHFHSTTPPSIAAFLAINNAFSSSNTNQEGNKFDDNSSQYDEEEEDESDSITDHPGVINGGTSHHFPVTTISSQIRPIGPEPHNVLQQNVKIQGTGESGLLLNQQNRQQQQVFQSQKTAILNQPTSTHSSHLYGHDYHQTPSSTKDPNAHSKHQINTQLILNQQRNNENKQVHGFKPISDSDDRNQFLLSSTTRQPPIFFTTKSSSGYSTTIHTPAIEPFSLHAIGPQPPLQTTQQSPSNSPFPPQTNAHQVPPNPLVQQIRSNIANNGGFLTQTIQVAQNPITFQFNSNNNNNNNNNNRQGHQLFTTPSVAVIATTSSTSSSSSVKSSPSSKPGNISPVISLTSSIGSTPKASSITNNTAVSVQLFSETTPPNAYDEYQEADVSSDPFFRDVPKISKPSTQLKSPSPTRHTRKRRQVPRKTRNAFVSRYHLLRYKRKAQNGLPTEVFGTEGVRYRNRPGGPGRSYAEESSHHSTMRGRNRADNQSRRRTLVDEIDLKKNSGRPRPTSFVDITRETSTVELEVPQKPSQYSSTASSLLTQKHSESAILEPVARPNKHQEHRTVVKVRRLHNQNTQTGTNSHNLSELSKLPHNSGSSEHLAGSEEIPVHLSNAETTTQVVLATAASPVEITYEIPSASVRITADNSKTPQDFTRNVPKIRTHDRGDHTRSQYQTSSRNLEQERNVDNTSQRSRQRSRQRTREGSANIGHETQEHPPRSTVRRIDAANRRVGQRHPVSENVKDITPSRQAQDSPNTRYRGRKLGGVSTTQYALTPDDVKYSVHETEVTTEVTVESSSSTASPLPETSFTCADKIPGGYYADLEADCQLFHICSLGRHGKITDNKFLCGPGTRFNQRSRTCQVRDLVDCSLSASLYHLNSHFKYPLIDETSKYDTGFEAKKIRTKRKAAKALIWMYFIFPAASSSAGGPQPRYTVDSIPETSFTCDDKPQDGHYADVETQCQVFHLCRTIAGKITLESSFVCPPGTVFNQPEGNCDKWEEVDCALYSAPEHSFRKTSPSGNKNHGSKGRVRRHTIKEREQTEMKNTKAKKKSVVKKSGVDKKYRTKRQATNNEKFDYYDYVDDNYEAHASKPIDKDKSSEQDKAKEDNIANVEDYAYDYDSAAVSSEKDAKEEPFPPESEENENNEDDLISGTNNDAVNEESGPVGEPYENVRNLATSTTESNSTPFDEYDSIEPAAKKELQTITNTRETEVVSNRNETKEDLALKENVAKKSTEEETSDYITSTRGPKLVPNQNGAKENKEEETSDYVYDYEYDDITTSSSPKNLKEVNSTSEKSDIENDPRPHETETNSNVKNIVQSTTETVTYIKNITEFTDVIGKLRESVTVAPRVPVTEKILNVDVNSKSLTNQNSAHEKANADEYEYEYYYDDEYVDETNGTETSSLPGPTSSTTETQTQRSINEPQSVTDSQQSKSHPANEPKSVVDSPHIESNPAGFYITEGIKKQPDIPKLEEEENVNAKYETSTHGTTTKVNDISSSELPYSKDITTEPSVNIRADISDRSTQKPRITETNITPELFETNTNPSFLQEIGRNKANALRDENDRKLEENYEDDITLSSLTTQLHKQSSVILGKKTTTQHTVFDERATTSLPSDLHEIKDETPESKVLPQVESASSLPNYDTTIATTAEPQEKVTSPVYDTTTSAEVTPHLQRDEISKGVEVTSYATIGFKEQPSVTTPVTTTTTQLPTTSVPSTIPSLFRPSKQREPRATLASRKPPAIRRNRTRGNTNYIGKNEEKSKKNHRFTVASSEKPDVNTPQLNARRRSTTTLAPTLVADDPVANDQVTSSQNAVSSLQPSDIKHEETTVPYLGFSTNGVDIDLKTENPPLFTKSSKLSANSVDESLYSKIGVVSTFSPRLSSLSSLENSSLKSASNQGESSPLLDTTTVKVSDGSVHNHSVSDYSVGYGNEKDFKLNGQSHTTEVIFSINDLATPFPTTTPSIQKFPSQGDTGVLENTSPTPHLGYTLSSVNSQPSVSFDSKHTETGFVCTGKELHKYHPDPDDCRMFHYCSPGFHSRQVLDFRFTCEDGTVFKVDTQKCEDESLVPSCAKGKK